MSSVLHGEINNQGQVSTFDTDPSLLKLVRQWCLGGALGKQFLNIIVITRRPYHHGCLSSDVLCTADQGWYYPSWVRWCFDPLQLDELAFIQPAAHLQSAPCSPCKTEGRWLLVGPCSERWKIKARCNCSYSDNCWWLNIPFIFTAPISSFDGTPYAVMPISSYTAKPGSCVGFNVCVWREWAHKHTMRELEQDVYGDVR